MRGTARPRPKRFYAAATCEAAEGGYCVRLDGKPLRTPARGELKVPGEALAREIAREWNAQGDEIDAAAMPMTRRANTALDRVRGCEAQVAEEIVAYAGSDLLCYRAETPRSLIDLQAAHWDPVLAWMESEFGAVFEVRAGITHVAQAEESLARVGEAVAGYDCFALTPLHTMTTLTGSALLTLAHACGWLGAGEMWAAAHVDEDWQILKWGEDAEAAARRAARRAEFDGDVRFLALVRSK